MKTVTFKITKEIIQESVNRMTMGAVASTNCAVAVAIREVYPHTSVGSTIVSITGDYMFDDVRIPLPTSVINYIDNFDRTAMKERINLPELEFTLEVPE